MRPGTYTRMPHHRCRPSGIPRSDISGRVYGNWTVLRFIGKEYWECRCTCGTIKRVQRSALRSGKSRSCGCTSVFGPIPLPNAEAGFRYFVRNNKTSAIKRGLVWELDEEFIRLLIQQPCHYCGCLPAQSIRAGRQIFTYNGIDRRDNEVGYTVSNSLPCCGVCNRMKHAMGYDLFWDHICKIAERISCR